MPELVTERVCAEVEGELVVFLIGMRINKLWKVWKWLPVITAMPRMLKELAAHPELGMLSARGNYGLRNLSVLQYWKSAEHLQAYARASKKAHLPAWQAFNRRVGTGGDVGIWHETYVVPQGHSESVYVNMPPYGLGLAGAMFPAKGQRATAAKRLARTKT
jgi:fumigallin biosynthesis monooxygenase-like protein